MSEAQKVYDLQGKRVWVAGHRGMVGSALVRRLETMDCQILTVDRSELDLRRQADVEQWVLGARPQAVFLAAALVGGIQANRIRPADFIYDNVSITTNVIHACHLANVEKLMFLGSSCIYPRLCEQPMRESDLMAGKLEPTNESYAIAKLAGISLCKSYRHQYGRDFVSVIPTNLYGPGDNFDPEASHVVPGLVRKLLTARQHKSDVVDIWGTGSPRREFLYVDDAADAMVFLMERYSDDDIINIGAGEDVSILELTRRMAAIVGFNGRFQCDTSKPDGMPRKQLDASRLLEMGWRPATALDHGLSKTVDWFEKVLERS